MTTPQPEHVPAVVEPWAEGSAETETETTEVEAAGPFGSVRARWTRTVTSRHQQQG